MSLTNTPTGVRHAIDVALCPLLPGGQRIVLLPLPGAPPYVCQHPCGGPCRFVSACPPPPPLPKELLVELRMAPTLAALVAEALGTAEPAGTAADLGGAKSWGGLRYYRN